jgi:hypothetical protein
MSTIQGQNLLPYADNFIPILRPGFPVIHDHTPDRPFCPDNSCPCHENDEKSIAQVQQWYQDGIITTDHATDIIMGRRAW